MMQLESYMAIYCSLLLVKTRGQSLTKSSKLTRFPKSRGIFLIRFCCRWRHRRFVSLQRPKGNSVSLLWLQRGPGIMAQGLHFNRFIYCSIQCCLHQYLNTSFCSCSKSPIESGSELSWLSWTWEKAHSLQLITIYTLELHGKLKY